MKITLTDRDGRVHAATLPYAGASHVDVAEACPCGSNAVGGTGEEIESRDTLRARALCMACGAARGVLRVQVDTLFGIEEDRRVMSGPWRVY